VGRHAVPPAGQSGADRPREVGRLGIAGVLGTAGGEQDDGDETGSNGAEHGGHPTGRRPPGCGRRPVRAQTSVVAGSEPTATVRRLEMVIAAAMISTARTDRPIRSETRFITLISGFSEGPAVSLNGSPTVSPITVAAWASLPLPTYWPSSTNFLALSQAPPEFDSRTAMRTPAAMAPAR